MYRKVWWLNPVALYGMLQLIVILAYNIDESQYWLLYNTERGIDSAFVLLHLICFMCFAIGFYISKKIKIRMKRHNAGYELSDNNVIISSVYRAYKIIFALCIAAYIIWYGSFISINGISILANFKSLKSISDVQYIIKRNSGRIPGITSFTNLDILVFVLGIYLIFQNDLKIKKFKLNRQLIIIAFLSAFRALAFSERLAIIEVALPAFIIYLSMTSNKKIRKIVMLMPIIAVIGLFIVFGLFEYPRSWLYHYKGVYNGTYLDFIIQRVSAYYCLAINTECLTLKYIPINNFPYHCCEWLWELPILSDIYKAFSNSDFNNLYTQLLLYHGNPEFNNPGGMLTFVKDFGIFFPFAEIIFGYIIGRFYRKYVKFEFWGTVVYPWLFLVLLELPRYFYLGNTRSCATYIGLIVILLSIRKNSKSFNQIYEKGQYDG